ncbi:MAG TPA: exopolysaccharide biosynthesis polyprenyl glycosylphosphotransferase [Candidatus Polarisedimenticolia bacterium]|nr:exopolysaccharide biosynthesis polyprenyl glycosylphosphotransferase [Candidatus Polarisedimenticolia bacterium]
MDGEREARRSVVEVSSADVNTAALNHRQFLFAAPPAYRDPANRNWEREGEARAPISPVLAPLGLLGCQSAAIVAAAMVVEYAERRVTGSPAFGPHLLIALVAAAIFPVMIASTQLSRLSARSGSIRTLLRSFTVLCLAGLAAIGSYKVVAHWPDGSTSDTALGHWVFAWLVTAAASLALLDMGAGAMLARLRRQGRLARRIVVFGAGDHGARFIDKAVQSWGDRLTVRAYFSDRSEDRAGLERGTIAGIPFRGDVDQLLRFVRDEPVDEIVIALPWSADERILSVLSRLRHLPIPVRLAPEMIALRELGGRAAGGAALAGRELDFMPVIRDRPISMWDQLVKDGFDRSMAALALLLAMPTMVVVALLIRWDSPGPVFFRQKRLGFDNRPFDILKFRTMSQAPAARETLQQARRGDSRVTRVGSFLRRSSLDELPQLINVLRGEMSLIGPRPHPMWTRADQLWPDQGDRPLEQILSEYASRHRVKPGITGWAQVCGCRGETETVDKMARRVEHDLHYIENWSLWLDIRILFLTLKTVVSGENAH